MISIYLLLDLHPTLYRKRRCLSPLPHRPLRTAGPAGAGRTASLGCGIVA